LPSRNSKFSHQHRSPWCNRLRRLPCRRQLLKQSKSYRHHRQTYPSAND